MRETCAAKRVLEAPVLRSLAVPLPELRPLPHIRRTSVSWSIPPPRQLDPLLLISHSLEFTIVTQGQVFTLAVSLVARERGVLGSSLYP